MGSPNVYYLKQAPQYYRVSGFCLFESNIMFRCAGFFRPQVQKVGRQLFSWASHKTSDTVVLANSIFNHVCMYKGGP
jgi:hypothetical protein